MSDRRSPRAWQDELRAIHDDALGRDWKKHLDDLNARLGLEGNQSLSTADIGLPPAWFNGDIEVVKPGQWVLVISLNPAKPSPGYYGDALTPERSWDFWRTHNREWWYPSFFRPLVQVAATALGEVVAQTTEPAFATDRMVFIELCPYASGRFALAASVLQDLSKDDPGFQYAAQVRRLLIEDGRPVLILVNGRPAIDDITLVEGDHLDWSMVAYPSMDGPDRRGRSKTLWHLEGLYETRHGSVPIVGFPFLRKPGTHNSNADIRKLGVRISEFIASSVTKDGAAQKGTS